MCDVKECVTELRDKMQHRPGSANHVLARPLSLRCNFCTYIHGCPLQQATIGSLPCCAWYRKGAAHSCGKADHRPPEDIAIRVAQAVAVLHTLWHGKRYPLHADLALTCAAKWTEVVQRLLPSTIGQASPGFASEGPEAQWHSDLQFPFASFQSCVLPASVQSAVRLAFISHLVAIKADMDDKECKALEPQRCQEARDRQLRIERLSAFGDPPPLTHEIQQVLNKYEHASPIFALESSCRQPRLTLGVTSDCKCCVPWNERSKWERLQHEGVEE